MYYMKNMIIVLHTFLLPFVSYHPTVLPLATVALNCSHLVWLSQDALAE